MADPTQPNSPASRPNDFEHRYRLYIDESGDHVYRKMATTAHQHLCLMGCWFKNPSYLEFHAALESLKSRFLSHHPDDPVVLHREDMINARKAFKTLQDNTIRSKFDDELLKVISAADFVMVAVIIDKFELWQRFGEAAPHPYDLGLRFLLQRYVGFLSHINRVGDVMAEARGGTEDKLLSETFSRLYDIGDQYMSSAQLQSTLTSRSLKLKSKSTNISGLQLADLLGHPVKQWVLQSLGLMPANNAPFAQRLLQIVQPKFNRHIYNNHVQGYGYVFYPSPKK